MRAPGIAVTALALVGCAASPPTNHGDPNLLAVTTDPAPGSKIDAATHLRVVGTYSVPDLRPGQDSIRIVLKTLGGLTDFRQVKAVAIK